MVKAKGRRERPRIPFGQPLTFDLAASFSEGLAISQHKASGVDVNKYGLGLVTSYPLKRDEVLRLHLPLRSAKTFVPVVARVVWAMSTERRFRAGLKFLA